MLGFNTGETLDVCWYGDIDWSDTTLDNLRADPACINALRPLQTDIVRFPGGTISQFYHFYGTGYGLVKDEVRGKKYDNPSLFGIQEIIDENFVEVYLDLAEGHKCVFVMNLWTGSFEENMACLAYLQEHIEVIGVELGNELYFPFWTGYSINRYVNDCRPYIDTLKKLGIPVAGIMSWPGDKTWNNRVRDLDFDAHVFHMYADGPRDDCPVGNYGCAMAEVDQFVDGHLPQVIKTYINNYGDVPLWFTEWNIAIHRSNAPAEWLYHTYVHTYFTFKMLNKMNELRLEMALYHSFAGGGEWFPVVHKRDTTVRLEPEYFAHYMIGRGEYLGHYPNLAGAQIWYYSDRVCIANKGGKKTFTVAQVQAALRSINPDAEWYYNTIEQVVADNYGDTPVWSTTQLGSTITIPGNSIVAIR